MSADFVRGRFYDVKISKFEIHFTAGRKNIFAGGLSLGRVVLYPAVAVIYLEAKFMELSCFFGIVE